MYSTKRLITILEEGFKIHLHSKQGMFTVVKVEDTGVHISCKIWIARAGYPDIIPTKFVKYSDVKCLAGGCNRPINISTRTVEYIEVSKQLV